MASSKKLFLEPTTQAFIDSIVAAGGKPIYKMSYEEARRVLDVLFTFTMP